MTDLKLTDEELGYLKGRLEVEADFGEEVNGTDQSIIEGLIERLDQSAPEPNPPLDHRHSILQTVEAFLDTHPDLEEEGNEIAFNDDLTEWQGELIKYVVINGHEYSITVQRSDDHT